jgi:hypothetical protein
MARRLLILKVKAPFSSPVAGSGKPFLPSLTLPAAGTFFVRNLIQNPKSLIKEDKTNPTW